MESTAKSAGSTAADLGNQIAEELIKSTEEQVAEEAVEEVAGAALELVPSSSVPSGSSRLFPTIRLPSAIQISSRNWIRIILFSGTAVVGTILLKRYLFGSKRAIKKPPATSNQSTNGRLKRNKYAGQSIFDSPTHTARKVSANSLEKTIAASLDGPWEPLKPSTSKPNGGSQVAIDGGNLDSASLNLTEGDESFSETFEDFRDRSSTSTSLTIQRQNRSRSNSGTSSIRAGHHHRSSLHHHHQQAQTLILKASSPQELVSYGLDSLKTSVKLWEEGLSKLQGQSTVISSATNNNENITSASPPPQTSQSMAIEPDLLDVVEAAKKLVEKLETLNKKLTPQEAEEEFFDDDEFDVRSTASIASSSTLPYFDVEPNLHFFRLFMNALDNVQDIPQPRKDRSAQLGCDSESEFTAKVYCLRNAFTQLFKNSDNREFFEEIGRQVLEMLMRHSLQDPSDCVRAYEAFLDFMETPDFVSETEKEIERRGITCVSFYDIVLDYFIMDSFDDIENPPSAVASVANNRWLSSGFRELALQTAVSAVLRHKRSKLENPLGFFGHFYDILEHVSPLLAWGFLGSDENLKLKCNLIKESLQDLIKDYFDFDRVRYTNYNDLQEDILRVTRERFWELNNKLSIVN